MTPASREIRKEARGNSELEFAAETVLKRYSRHAEVEYAKAAALSQIGQANGFIAPKPIEVRPALQEVVFERLPESRSIIADYIRHMTTASGDTAAVRHCREAGRVLGVIHRELALTTSHSWEPPPRFLAALPRSSRRKLSEVMQTLPLAFLHGDYGPENIEAPIGESARSTLTIFDASPNSASTFHTDERGPIYVDVGHFVSVIAGLLPPRLQLRARWRNRRVLAREFLTGYEASSGIACDPDIVALFARGIAGAYLHSRYPAPIASLATELTFSRHRGKLL
jgi:hypothetical protein